MKILKNNSKFILYSILTTFSIYVYPFMYLKNNILIYFLLLVIFILLFFYYKKLYNKINLAKKYKIFIFVMSFMFVIGYSYDTVSNASLMFSSILNIFLSLCKIMGYYLFFSVLIFYFIKFMQKEYSKKYFLIDKFSKHPFFYSFIFLSICYGILLVLYYPGILNYDNANQIKEVMGLHTRYLDAINPIKGSTLTNFNPIVHTILLGGFFKIGYFLNNVNLGLFFYTIFQLLIVIISYSYTISYSIKHKCNPLIVFIILIILGIIPIFGYYSITLVKDTLYTSFLLLFSLKIYDIYNSNNLLFKDYVDLFLISILVCLFRNNGIFIVIFTLPFLFFKQKQFIYVFLIICLSYFSFNNLLLPKLKVSGTSVREVLSIPFQQTARLVKLHPEVINGEDALIIGKILDYDNLAIDYNEDLADPVKNKYNKDASSDDLNNYLFVWFKYLFKYPSIYVDATINNVTGYFYPFENNWKIYHKLNPKLKEAGFNYHYNNLNKGRNIIYNYEIFMEASPIGLILNIALLTWFSILIILSSKKKIFLIPNIISILFCFLSPANTYYRYIYPTLILMVCLFPLIKANIENKTHIE